MDEIELSISTIEKAFQQLKANTYGDTTNIFLRAEIANYESSPDFQKKLEAFQKAINTYKKRNSSKYIEDLISKIKYRILPKKLRPTDKDPNAGTTIISNDPTSNEYYLKKVLFFIDCPIEIHLIAILWVTHCGQVLDSALDKSCFGNRLKRTESGNHKKEFTRVFTPYYKNYQSWRDDAIEVVRDLHKRKIDSTLITLDIKNFFYAIDYEITDNELLKKSSELYFLTDLLGKIHTQYRKTIGATNTLLPIGLVSSGVIANFVLNDFDKKVKSEIKPAYFGRYVDDIILVLSNIKYTYAQDSKRFLDTLFKPYTCFKTEDNFIKIDSDNGNFQIQFEKVKIISVANEHPISIIDEFQKNIRESSSEARMLLEHPDLLSRFDSESAKLIYSDSIYKVRSLDEFEFNKLGASTYLTNLIDASKNTKRMSKDDTTAIYESIESFFSGTQALESYALWEKIITYCIIRNNPKRAFKLAAKLVVESNKIQLSADFQMPFDEYKNSKNKDIAIKVATALIEWLFISFSMAISLNPKASENGEFKEYLKKKITEYSDNQEEFADNLLAEQFPNLHKNADAIRETNLFRHRFVSYPLLNYCRQNKNFSLSNIADIDWKNVSFKIDDKLMQWSPRYIHYHEVQIFALHARLHKGITIDPTELYINLNSLSLEETSITDFFPAKKLDSNKEEYFRVRSENEINSLKKKVGIANIRLNEKDAYNAISGSPNLHYDRQSELNKVLNLAKKESVDLMLFPETLVPLEWLEHIAKFSKKHDMGIITGLEHYRNGNQVLNLLAHILPFTYEGYRNVAIFLRNKEHFSPEEDSYLNEMKLQKSKDLLGPVRMDWNGLQIATFNCFEATDIVKRAQLKAKVDFLVLVENNRDTEYFSSLVESTARDIHCYVAQVNNSAYGDSRITLPARSFERDQLRIKGGQNSTLLVEEIDFNKLRHFHHFRASSTTVYKDNAKYKPLPPDFLPANSRKARPYKK